MYHLTFAHLQILLVFRYLYKVVWRHNRCDVVMCTPLSTKFFTESTGEKVVKIS